jgi:hypothetical protein
VRRVPQRPVLAIKVENLPVARPQSGLNGADLVYEEPVEAGITRFIVVYQCGSADRVEPVRSGRLVDPDILVQFGHHVLFAYAGAIGPVVAKVDRTLVDLSFSGFAGSAYYRDPSRSAPHNLVTSTAALWAFARGRAPHPIFSFSRLPLEAPRPASTVHIFFSPYSDVFWHYVRKRHAYYRFYNNLQSPAMLSDGSQIVARNVIVQAVPVFPSPYVEDATGSFENYVNTVGSGPVVIFRNGQVIRGVWRRHGLHDITRYYDRRGRLIPLAPGRTWIELVPLGHPVHWSR